jgi:hypothetical protein
MTDVGIPAFIRKRLEPDWTKWNRYCTRSFIFFEAEKIVLQPACDRNCPRERAVALKQIASRRKEKPDESQ